MGLSVHEERKDIFASRSSRLDSRLLSATPLFRQTRPARSSTCGYSHTTRAHRTEAIYVADLPDVPRGDHERVGVPAFGEGQSTYR